MSCGNAVLTRSGTSHCLVVIGVTLYVTVVTTTFDCGGDCHHFLKCNLKMFMPELSPPGTISRPNSARGPHWGAYSAPILLAGAVA